MTLTRTLAFALLSAFLQVPAWSQCTNTSPYPSNSIVPNSDGTVTTITTCNWQTEYSTITGIVANTAYEFTVANNLYITVHQGTFNGPVLGHGYSPLTVVATSNANLYPHWNVNDACGTAQNCAATTVRRFLDCVPPTVSVSTENDCDNEQFTVFVLVSDTGDASALSFVYTMNGGGLTVETGIGLGYHPLGPFPLGSLIDLTVVHDGNADCNVVVNDITNLPCAIISCGPDTYTHCYGNNENYLVHYQGDSNLPLSLHFNSGAVSPSGNDALVIHDGLYITDPILFSGVGNGGDLTGVTVVSTNPLHALTLHMTSNASFSCADGGVSPEWNYTVECSSCTQPVGEAGPTVPDCDAGTFTVPVVVIDMGGADTLWLQNSVGVDPFPITAAGTYTAGPFPVGAAVSLMLDNTASSVCDRQLGVFEAEGCPIAIQCTGPLHTDSYCYTNSDAKTWLYQSMGGQPLAIQFSAGTIESVSFDHLVIHDGVDASAPVLWQHTLTTNESLVGVMAVSTGPALFMEMTSDNSISCASGNFGAAGTWQWTVGCLDCTNPAATWEVNADCSHHTYTVALNVTDLGTADDLRVSNSLDPDTLNGIGLGITTLGPFAIGSSVSFSLINSTNELCRINSPSIGYNQNDCIIQACDLVTTEHCYANGDSLWYTYASGINVPISISFLAGTMLPGDQVMLFNGPDTTYQLVYAGNYGGNLAGLSLTSNNPVNAITLLIVTDGAGSCATGEAETAMQWSVGCGLVGSASTAAVHPEVFPVPSTGALRVIWPASLAEPRSWSLLDAAGRQVAGDRIVQNAGGWSMDLSTVGVGRYVLWIRTDNGSQPMPVVLTR